MNIVVAIGHCLGAILSALWLLSSTAYAEEVTCTAPDACAAQDGLLRDLHSDDRFIFQSAFLTLRKSDFSKLHTEIRNLTFDNTDEDKARAVMIGQVITQSRRKITPTHKDFDYWMSWYDAANPADTAHLIPTYMLFSFHEKISDQIASGEKNISNFREWREYTLQNPEGRPDYLSEQVLTKKIQAEQSHLASLPDVLDKSSIFLTEDEDRTLKNYFRIFESLSANNQFQYRWKLPFSKTLETAIQTPRLWEDKFQSFLKCEPLVEQSALISQLIALNPNSLSLNTCLRQRLANTDDFPELLQTLSLITRSDVLRSDPYIRDAVSAINADNPFTSVRVARQFALSPETAETKWGNDYLMRRGPRADAEKAMNTDRSYCEPGPVSDFPYVKNAPKLNPRSPEFKATLTTEYFQMGAPVMTVKTPSGYLTGHDRGEFGGGLLYYANENSAPKNLYERNMIAIIESDTRGIYWGLSGLNHLMPGQGTILRIDARTDNVSIDVHKRMPIVTRNVKLLENGNLFMDFRRPSYTSYKDGEEKVVQVPSSDYNPPVLLTRTGEIMSACGD